MKLHSNRWQTLLTNHSNCSKTVITVLVTSSNCRNNITTMNALIGVYVIVCTSVICECRDVENHHKFCREVSQFAEKCTTA